LKQNSFRFLASVNAIPETDTTPALNFSAGVQGIGTGNPGFSGTLEKNWSTPAGQFNAYAGVGFRSNENHVHPVGGMKLTLAADISVGLQDDGHRRSPFVTYSHDWWTAGIYLIGFEKPAYLFGVRF
jgi:hypothetical protein